jgi:acetylornithine deacetylase/succinyl-diaminopimelate desuccinylase-like protein
VVPAGRLPTAMRACMRLAALGCALVATSADASSVAGRAPELLRQLLRIDTVNPPGNEIDGAHFLADVLAQAGIESTIYQSAPGRANLFARVPGSGEQGAALLLSHLDVVPADAEEWDQPPFAGDLEEGVIHGRGALDCKGVSIIQALALVAVAAREVPLARDVILLATADEETGGHLGAGWMLEKHPELFEGVDFVLNEGGFIHRDPGRPLVFNFNAAEKGPCWFRVTAEGEPGHGSRPSADNAPARLVRALAALLAWERPWQVLPVVQDYFAAASEFEPDLDRALAYRDLRTALADPEFYAWFTAEPSAAALIHDTLAPNVLVAGTKTNVVPGKAWADVDSRLLPGHDCSLFLDEVRAQVGAEQVTVESIGVSFPSSASEPAGPVIDAVRRLAAEEGEEAVVLPGMLTGFTDSHWFRRRGIPAYGFVPLAVDIPQRKGVHAPNERVEAAELSRAVDRLVRLLELSAEPLPVAPPQ